PGEIDINIHPTKTEIKFENDSAIWQIINATVRESLGKHNVVPSIDFDMEGSVEIPIRKKYSGEISFPEVVTDPDYNPFTEKGSGTGRQREYFRVGADHWESLYNPPDTGDQSRIAFKGDEDQKMPGGEYTGKKVLQLKQKYILTPVKSGIMVIDQKRAHERILYEKFMEILKTESIVSQQELFPQKIELDTADSLLLKSILDDLLALGFDIREFGTNTFVVNGTPGLLDTSTPQMIVEKLLEEYKNSPVDAQAKVREQVAGSLAKASALDYGIELKREEADRLIDKLFTCETPNYSPDGKKVLTIIPLGDIEKLFNI
ncbi:MAG: DNA mismatch repair protein MutL, partial [Bacteroidales bacterium]|nr:DNA mismatch repair protein MutL [Bacteroidales bacterium]